MGRELLVPSLLPLSPKEGVPCPGLSAGEGLPPAWAPRQEAVSLTQLGTRAGSAPAHLWGDSAPLSS